MVSLEKIKEMVISYSKKYNHNPSTRDLKKEYSELPNYHSYYVKNFGLSLREIIDSSGLEIEFMRKPFAYSDDMIIEIYKKIAHDISRTPSFSDIDEYGKFNRNIPTAHTMRSRFGSIEKLAELSGLYKKTDGAKYKNEYLAQELQRFQKEFGRIPIQKDFEKLEGYPSRKTFTNTFGSFDNALRAAGFDVKEKPQYSKEYLINEIHRYIREFGKQPFNREMDAAKGYPSKHTFEKFFGSWNNAIKEAGLKVRVSHYTDEELEFQFKKFVEINGRIPTIHEFNDSEYPSFWCYQARFGSWNNAVQYYGFEVNEGASGSHHEFENGEVCKSRYEFDVSTWLRINNISYLRNVPYKDLLNWYNGRKDCDYVIIHNGEWVFVEIAGLYTFREKKSGMERDYVKRFDHKVKNLLIEFNHKIFYPDDFKHQTLDELFDFLWEIPECPWSYGEPIYQGVAEDIDEYIEWLENEEEDMVIS